MADLWEKLQAAQRRQAQAPVPEPSPSLPGEPAPQGWSWVAPLVATRTLGFAVDPGFWEALGSDIDPSAWEGVLCFDTETTGLSGGAGTVPFLIGWASLVPGAVPHVDLRQWFLRDLPGEPALVEILEVELSRAQGLVSFNGASYDLPLLKSRWALAGKPFPDKPHRDNLPAARRLWRRLLESCRLPSIEESVLGLRRVDDVPGALVPALWFDYLRRGAAPDFVTPLEGVFRHHAQDVYSLLCLDLVLRALERNPRGQRWRPTFGPVPRRVVPGLPGPEGLWHPDLGASTPVDFWGLLALQEPGPADDSLAAAWADDPTEAVGLAWAERLKRRGDPRARDIWTALWEQNSSFVALEELVKWLEHRDRTPEARAEALGRVEAALKAPFLPRVWRQNLEKRRARLEKRVLGPGATGLESP